MTTTTIAVDRTPTSTASFDLRWPALIGIAPAIVLPFYNQFLHGGRTAAEILPRSADYAAVHILGAVCMFLCAFGLIALYASHARKLGRLGRAGFLVALLAQMMYAGNLLIDGFFNPLLAKFDPVLQTRLHSADFLRTASSGDNYLGKLLGSAYLYDPITSGLYLLGFALLGVAVIRARAPRRAIGVLLVVGGALLSAAIMIPQWLESIGYAAVGAAVAWSGWLVARGDRVRP